MTVVDVYPQGAAFDIGAFELVVSLAEQLDQLIAGVQALIDAANATIQSLGG